MTTAALIADIIPNRKTPRGVDTFTYSIPQELHGAITVGTSVVIPFRSQEIIGVVHAVKNTTDVTKKIKPITRIHTQQLWQRPDRIALLEWFADTYWVSQGTALHVLSRDYTMQAVFPELRTEIIQKDAPQIILFDTTQSHEKYIQESIQKSSGPCIIIAPELHHVQELERICTAANIDYVNIFGTTSKKRWTQAQQIALGTDIGTKSVIIGSRTALFLACNPSVTIIIDYEHEKAHKQYNMNPRYRAGAVADFLFHQPLSGVSQLQLASPTPTTAAWKQYRQKEYELIDAREHALPSADIIDMNHYTNDIRWLSDQAVQQISRSKQSLLFLNRIGSTAYGICTDCGKANQESDLRCQFCNGSAIKIVRKGIQQLEREIQKAFPDKVIFRIDSSVDQDPALLDSQIARADIIVGTEKALRTAALSRVDSIIVLSVDHLLTYPHYQSQERVFQLLMELRCAEKDLLIQTHAAHHPIWNFLKNNNVSGFLDAELSIRTIVKRPPMQPLWIARNPKTQETLRVHTLTDIATLPPSWLIDFIDD